MSMKRKWLKAIFLMLLAFSMGQGPINPKQIEDLFHIMNETKVEFTIPDEGDSGDGSPSLFEFGTDQPEEPSARE